MNTIEHKNAQGGITITSNNLTRFNKRLHKAMQEAGLDISYSTASQFFAKACGKKNVHELTDILKTSEKVSQGYTSSLVDISPDLHPGNDVRETKTMPDFYGNPVEVGYDVMFALNKLLTICKNYANWGLKSHHIYFLKKPASQVGDFQVVINKMLGNYVRTQVLNFEGKLAEVELLIKIYSFERKGL